MEIESAVIQFDVKKGRVQENLGTVFDALSTAAAQKVQLAVLPEMFSCSFDNEELPNHTSRTPDIINRISRFAAAHNMAIAGSLPEKKDGRIYNTLVYVDGDGEIKGRYQKLHLFRLTNEHHYYTPGKEIVCTDTSLGKIGLMTCYDLRFPELARSLFLKGARLIVVSAQWPAPRKDQWQMLIQARAVENQLFMVCANRTGTEDNLTFPGRSLIVDPLGHIAADAGNRDGVFAAGLDMKKVDAFRRLIPCKTDRRPEIYG